MVSIFFKNDLVVSMKRITKNNDGLFEITNKNKNLPEFSNENIPVGLICIETPLPGQ